MTKKKEEKAVVAKEETPLAVFEDFEQYSGQGFEEADKDAFAIPFIRILQGLSPQVNEDESAYIEGAKPGMFFNTVTGELFGRYIRVIPIHYARDFVEWLPNRGGFVKSHGPNPSVLERVAQIDDKNNQILDNGNIIQDARNHFVLLADHLEIGPVILSLASSGIKHSRKWMTLMNALLIPGKAKQAPMFAGVWGIESVINKNDDGTWYQVGDKSGTCIKFEGWVNADQLHAATAARTIVTSGEAKADYDSTIDSSEASGETTKYDDDHPF